MADPADPQVVQLELGFVNAFLVQGKHPILVDAGMPDHHDDLVEAMAEHGVRPEDLSLILLTHGHLDHFGSVAQLKHRTEAPVAIHQADAGALRRGRNPELTPVGLLGRLMKPVAGGDGAPGVEPDILLEGHEPLDRFGVHGRIVPTPGHTAGSITLELDNGRCLIGDLLARRLRATTPGWPPFAEDLDQLRSSLGELIDRKPRRLYAGHGGPFEPDEVAKRLL